MSAITDHPLDRVREARATLAEVRDHIADDGGERRDFALAELIRTSDQAADDPIWSAVVSLVPPRPGEPVDEASEQIRQHAVEFLAAVGDCEDERRDGGISVATFERLRRSHAAIGHQLDRIRLEA
jgi:hypothetical protein